MRGLIQQPKDFSSEVIPVVLAVWRVTVIPTALLAVASSFYADNRLEPFLVLGGLFLAGGLVGGMCCAINLAFQWIVFRCPSRG